MGKKVKEYKSGDFIFAKVKGYPAWPARVQKLNGKKYFVYFYGTGETANLPPTQIFDYAENKDKFLTKTVKRRDFNDGVKQIEYDFANNVPLEQVVGLSLAAPEDASGNNTINDTANETADDSMAMDTTLDETFTEESNTQSEGVVEDSDDTGALVIDEGKQKARKSTAKTPAKETPKPKEPKTPRGKGKKEESDDVREDEKREEEIVSRSGRKIRPKRYIDEHTEENTALPSPAPKKRRAASPAPEKDKKEVSKEVQEKNIKHFNTVPQSELEDLKEPYVQGDGDRENILIAYLPTGEYVGIKLFQARPANFKNDAAKLQWDKQSATNAITLKTQLERGHISANSIVTQLVMDLNLTEEEKATLDKERETEEKKSRVQFLKTEMKLIELDAKIKTCLCLEKADTELCLKLLDELMDLEVKPLMLLKHPSCLETIKRMRAYVGNTPSWDLSERAVLLFSQHAHRIRRQTDALYTRTKGLFTVPKGLSFWEYFQERVAHFKKVTTKFTSDELLEMVHEPIEMSMPASYTIKAAIDAVNEADISEDDKKKQQGKTKKPVNTPSKPTIKRQTSKKQEEKQKSEEKEVEVNNKQEETEELFNKESESPEKESIKENSTDKKSEEKESTKDNKEKKNEKEVKKDISKDKKNQNEDEKEPKKGTDKKRPSTDENQLKRSGSKEKRSSLDEKYDSIEESNDSDTKKDDKISCEDTSTAEKKDKKENNRKESIEKEIENSIEEKGDKDKDREEEPKAKRMRETKKTDPPPRSPTKRKSKF